MTTRSTWKRTLGLVLASFAGGALVAQAAQATTAASSPYAPFDQLARVLVMVENEYVEPAPRDKIIDGAIKGMVAELDPHSAYMNPAEFSAFQGDTQGKFGGVGVEVDYRDEYVTVIAPIEGSPAARAGIRSGDQIVAIDGKSTRGERLDKLITVMRGDPGSKVRVTVRRKGADDLLHFDLIREEIHVSSVESKRLVGDVGYLRLKQFQSGTHKELLKETAALRAASKAPLVGVILDMRSNPGGLVDEAEAVADEFLGEGTIYSTRHRGKVIEEVKARAGGAFASIPIIVLVNEYSASSAELVAGALQDSRRATVVGANTFGKGSVQTIFELPAGAGMRLTTMRYYTPNGRSIQADGIHPDIVIQSAEGGAAPPDVVRERDLDGHLPAERGGEVDRPQSVVVDKTKASEGPEERGPREVPVDPVKGDDFALSVGYQLLLKGIADKR